MLDILQKTDLTLGPLLTTFLLGFTTVVLLLWYSARKQTYWKKLGIPYVKPLPLIGSVHENMRRPLQDVEWDRYNKYGRLYGYYEGNTALLSVAKPEIIRNILVKDFQAFTGGRILETGERITDSMLPLLRGEDWKRIRTTVTPIFTTGKLKRMMNILKDCSGTLVQNFKKAAEKGEPIEVKRFYGAFAMDIIASSAFSTKIDSHNDPNNLFVQSAKGVVNFSWRFVVFALFPGWMKSFKFSPFPPKVINFLANVTLQIIEERKRTGQKRNDFLQLLLDAAQEDFPEGKLEQNEKNDITENYGKEENDQVFKQTSSKKTLSHEEIIAQCMLFFIAGFETVSVTLAFVSYCLALNPDIQEKVIQELDSALRENNWSQGELMYEAVQSMKYLDNVISETLRLYPTSIRVERRADEDYKLGDTGLTIPKGMIVGVPVYAMHRDPEHFPDPEKFDPDRFTPEERAKRHQYVYMPFGVGPRNCVGMRFALLEMKVCLAHVLSNFRIKKCPQTKVPLDFNLSPGILQPKNITLALEVRKDAVKAL